MIKTFGDLVNFKREERGLSLNKLSKEVQLDVAYISKIEKNQTKQPSFTSVSKIASFLEITNEELATVFNVNVIKNDSYKINNDNIEIKNMLTSMNDTIVKNAHLLTEDSLSVTIEILQKLKSVTNAIKSDKTYIIMLGSLQKIDIVVCSHVYDVKIKNFLENVYSKDVAIAIEGSTISLSREILTNIFDVIELARDNEEFDEEEIIKFEKYLRQQTGK
ncbi:helix-turn-helix transcriptional regulator [Clostridium sp. UBA1353]|uniref:helix-turn-helix domain-containing protein n=1 Tax=Clostridium sp. UBA1353 TaxID=1946347 RepID=UPI003217A9F4